VQEQLNERSSKLGAGALADSITALNRKIAELQGGKESSFFGLPHNGKQPENFSTLNQHFGNLLSVADSADSAPTSQARGAYREEENALKELQKRWLAARSEDIPKLNTQLAQAGHAQIDLERPPSSQLSSSDSDDEP
jgi:hypothetical protein